ncbi:hypothetical protein K488DRAFT_67832 [Vararia minispora EC-137]|uniref:Uncharacterized protein n=1 Tax=Vararia minispora EC-137 TaxID=1314806 RepID=A0ACB8QX67_9AGAM|nr:hypothetical protein K488DRAFT_67832 [Vararia minispora EC-137]
MAQDGPGRLEIGHDTDVLAGVDHHTTLVLLHGFVFHPGREPGGPRRLRCTREIHALPKKFVADEYPLVLLLLWPLAGVFLTALFVDAHVFGTSVSDAGERIRRAVSYNPPHCALRFTGREAYSPALKSAIPPAERPEDIGASMVPDLAALHASYGLRLGALQREGGDRLRKVDRGKQGVGHGGVATHWDLPEQALNDLLSDGDEEVNVYQWPNFVTANLAGRSIWCYTDE